MRFVHRASRTALLPRLAHRAPPPPRAARSSPASRCALLPRLALRAPPPPRAARSSPASRCALLPRLALRAPPPPRAARSSPASRCALLPRLALRAHPPPRAARSSPASRCALLPRLALRAPPPNRAARSSPASRCALLPRLAHRAPSPPRVARIPRPARGWGESAAGQVGHRVRSMPWTVPAWIRPQSPRQAAVAPAIFVLARRLSAPFWCCPEINGPTGSRSLLSSGGNCLISRRHSDPCIRREPVYVYADPCPASQGRELIGTARFGVLKIGAANPNSRCTNN